jgi:hypothetical protein
MRRRALGGTGTRVSDFALGEMMFGARGNSDHDESVRMIHLALDACLNAGEEGVDGDRKRSGKPWETEICRHRGPSQWLRYERQEGSTA